MWWGVVKYGLKLSTYIKLWTHKNKSTLMLFNSGIRNAYISHHVSTKNKNKHGLHFNIRSGIALENSEYEYRIRTHKTFYFLHSLIIYTKPRPLLLKLYSLLDYKCYVEISKQTLYISLWEILRRGICIK